MSDKDKIILLCLFVGVILFVIVASTVGELLSRKSHINTQDSKLQSMAARTTINIIFGGGTIIWLTILTTLIVTTLPAIAYYIVWYASNKQVAGFGAAFALIIVEALSLDYIPNKVRKPISNYYKEKITFIRSL